MVGEQYFLWLSDVHYDPHYATPDAFMPAYYGHATCNSTADASSIIGAYGCDSSNSLVSAALKHAVDVTKARSPSSPAFVIISGDSIRHGVDQLFEGGEFREGGEARNKNTSAAASAVEDAAHSPYHVAAMNTAGDILQELVSMVEIAFPGVGIIVSIGNNDVVPDYYLQLQEEDAPLGSLPNTLTPESAGMIGVIFKALSSHANNSTTTNGKSKSRAILKADDEWTFLRGGYYSRNIHDGTLTVLSLNTVLYSTFFNPVPKNVDDPGLQFEWMRKMLTYCRQNGAQAVIVGHIPPAVGSFRHTQLWKEGYVQT